jgi:hypothetical protein
MRALAYLLGARALDIDRDAGSVRPLPDAPMDPIATTTRTAAAWRRWAEAREASPAVAVRRPTPARRATQPKQAPV